MNCVILGPTDIGKIKIFGKVTDITRYVNEASDFFVRNFDEIIIIPDEGLPLQIANLYKESRHNGMVVGYVPGQTRGGKNLDEYFKCCDRVEGINGGWYNLNTELTRSSDYVFCLGFSAGVFIELCSIKYNQQYLNLKTKIYIDERCVSTKLPQEVAIDLINLVYFDNFKTLDNHFEKLCKSPLY